MSATSPPRAFSVCLSSPIWWARVLFRSKVDRFVTAGKYPTELRRFLKSGRYSEMLYLGTYTTV